MKLYPSHALSASCRRFSFLLHGLVLFYCSLKAVLEILKVISVLKSPPSNLVSGFPGIPAPEESPHYSMFVFKKKGN